MKDRNLYTAALFLVGIFAFVFAGYSFFKSTYDIEVLILMSSMIVCLVLMPIKLPNGIVYTAAIIGHLYCLCRYGLGVGTMMTTLSAVMFFAVFARPFMHIKWYRLFTTIGMYFVSLFASWVMLEATKGLPLFVRILAICFTFDNVNLLLRAGIMKAVTGTPIFAKKTLNDFIRMQLGLFVCCLILFKFSFNQSLLLLTVEVIFTVFSVGIINYFISAYIKQIVKIEESNQRYKSLFEQNPDIVFTLDIEGKYTSVNPMLEKILGYTQDDFVGQKTHHFLEAFNPGKLRDHIQLVMEGKPQEFTLEALHKDGSKREFFVTCAPTVVNHAVVGAYGIAKDITSDKELERLIHQLAFFDSTTGLPNRVSFNKRLAEEIELAANRNTRLGLLYIDLDQFKSINDALGHHIGDLLLVEVAKRLSAGVTERDLVARLGGDEFTIVLSDIRDAGECTDTAEAILEAFVAPFDLQGQEVFTTPSIGISLFPDHGDEQETLVKNADASMYSAKESGGNAFVVFSSDLQEAGEERLMLQTNLRKALERNEFHLVYQPQLDFPSKSVKGVEALIRWNSQEMGPVYPAKFIPIAEKSRLIIPIGEWVLRTACAQNKAWQDEGYPPITVAVNLSTIQFQNDDLVATVRSVLQDTGLAAKWLELEITESLLLQNTTHTLEVLNELQSLGVKISMDDFGVGYSSLSYLNNFPFDCLKIDQSFIRQLNNQPKDDLIVGTVIHLAHSLNMKVIAEGVETMEQLVFLQSQHCEGAQGYLISKPLPADKVKDGLWTGQSVYHTVRHLLTG